MEKQNTYTVATVCWTYNQAKYIGDTLTGFTIQQTNFPVVYIIIDDASTDGERDVLKLWAQQNLNFENETESCQQTYYGELLYGKHKNNANALYSILLLAENHYQAGKGWLKIKYISEWLNNAKYNAWCEGDDYWIDANKLSKQVAFMEKHPGHSMCFHAHKNISINNEKNIYRYSKDIEEVPIKDIILGDGSFMASASMFYRRDLEKDIPEWRKNAPIGDYALVLQLSTLGKVGYIKDNMCCYRVNTEGSWTKRIAIDNEMYKKWYKGCMKMFDGYDAWSCNKYHKYIMSMKNKLRIARVKRFIHKFI